MLTATIIIATPTGIDKMFRDFDQKVNVQENPGIKDLKQIGTGIFLKVSRKFAKFHQTQPKKASLGSSSQFRGSCQCVLFSVDLVSIELSRVTRIEFIPGLYDIR